MREERALIEAFGYLRVSGRGQLADDGLPRQRESIQRYADAKRINIVRWFEERRVRCYRMGRPAGLGGRGAALKRRSDDNRRAAGPLGARVVHFQEYILRDLKQRGVTVFKKWREGVGL